MITDKQKEKLMSCLADGKTLAVAALKAGMSEKTARTHRSLIQSPSEIKAQRVRHWRTRKNPFSNIWSRVEEMLNTNPGLEAKTIFQFLQRELPGKFQDGQLRTFQRKVKHWRGVHGPGREVFFPQVHKPGKLCQSDFTHMDSLGITIDGVLFRHMIYHFVLTYSNWETGTVCYSESFESLSEGFQKALWNLGGVPSAHQTDRLSTAINNANNMEEFTQRYKALLSHYNIAGRKIQTGCPNENGDIEQRHHRFKKALKQSLMLRGSSNFASKMEYERFLERLFSQLNGNRTARFQEELPHLNPLPLNHLPSCTKLTVRVRAGSTICVKHNIYSVHSRLIGEQVQVRLFAEHLEIWFAQQKVETLPRLRGAHKHRIEYRHVIDWLVRKPGAFENYRYRNDLFPTSRFRMAYDVMRERYSPQKASREYLAILETAAKVNESLVDGVLRFIFDTNSDVCAVVVRTLVEEGCKPKLLTDVDVDAVNLDSYDTLLEENREVA